MSMETPGVTQFTESMKYYGIWTGGYEQPYAMYAPAIVPPPENSDTIESWEFFYEIAKRLGRQIVYHANYAGTGEHWDKLTIPFPLPLNRRRKTEEMFEFMCAGSRVPLSEVKRHVHSKLFEVLDIPVKTRASDLDAMQQL